MFSRETLGQHLKTLNEYENESELPEKVTENFNKKPKGQRPASQTAPDFYEPESQQSDFKRPSSRSTPSNIYGAAWEFSHTEIFLGLVAPKGRWMADQKSPPLLDFGAGKMLTPLTPGFVYFSPRVNLITTFSSPRTFILGGGFGTGLIATSQRVLPFVGFQGAATRVVTAGKGQSFGLAFGPELGLFPTKVGSIPLSVRFQYTLQAAKLAGDKPAWFSFLIGAAF